MKNSLRSWLGALALGLVVSLAGGFGAAPSFAQSKPEDKVAALKKILPDTIEFKYGSVGEGATPGSALIKDVVVTERPTPPKPGEPPKAAKAQKPIKIAEIELREIDDKNPHANFADVEFRRIQIPLDDEDQKDLKAMGYSEVVLNVGYKFRYDQPKATLTISEIRFDGVDMGSLSLALSLGGIQSIDWNDQKALQNFMIQATVIGASLQYKDQSLIERALKKEATEKNQTVDQIRAAKMADVQQQEDQEQNPAAKAIYAELRKFLTKPGTITISAKPPQPLPLMAVMAMKDLGQVVEVFGLKVKAE